MLVNNGMGFLRSRKFCVKVDGKRSSEKSLKILFIQGSILGPLLSTLYLRNLKNPPKLNNC